MAKIKSFGAQAWMNGFVVGGVTDITAPATEVSTIDDTSHDTSGGFRTFLTGLQDGGTLELTGKYNYADDGQAEWKAQEGMPNGVLILLSDKSGLAFDVIVGGFQTTNPIDDAVEFTATAKITGGVYAIFPTYSVSGTLTSNGSTGVTFTPFTNHAHGNGHLLSTNASGDTLFWLTGEWHIQKSGGGAEWTSTAPVATPDMVSALYPGAWHATTNPHGWKPVPPATGTPVLTAS